MINRKLGVLVTMLFMIALFAAGCDKSEDSTASENEDGNSTAGMTEKTVKLYNFKVEMAEQLNNLIGEFEKETGVKIEVDTCGGGCDYSAGLKTRFNSGDKPDIFFVAGHSDLDLWEEHLEDLSDQPWVGDIVELAKPAITKDEKIYGMPLAVEGWGFIYNKTLFSQAGITDPPKTLTELQEAAEKLKAAGIRPFENGYGEWWVVGNHLLNVAFSHQSDPVAFVENVMNGKQKLIGNEKFEQWLKLVDLTVEYGQQNSLQTDYNTQVTNFAQGKAAMMQQGIWTQLQIDRINPKIEIGFLPMPINDNAAAMDKLPVGVANYWVVSKTSQVKEEAKTFLNWLVTSDAGTKFIVEDAKLIPAFKSIPASEEQLGPLAADIIKYTREGKILPWMWQRFPGYEANTSQMATQIQAYIGKQIGKKQLLEEFQKIWDDF
ncbi:ABC transporter substrate-binding protein [Paenibacillus sp. N4]|nr:ABC transporter substrate-binding protein [Paenibacillus vietnamensis]